ncbi:ROK family protein [Sphaerisporangium album]|uniref:ROK family protein n=1 Tax=Sphaerisporangium album TaxID=509200 RepID=A0A367FQU8_9ACTN|nr:ROK family protein [Sphaerisporangium album]RCG32222.1 ROK family protein [Sphaerisporangium album]
MSPGFVLGIDFGGTKVALATAPADSVDRPLRKVRLPTLGGEGAEQVLRRTLEAARELAGGSGTLQAVGVSTFGVVRGDTVRLAPTVPGWEGLELPRLLREEFGDTPVAIDNDVNAAAAAELRWGALRDVGTGLYLNLGTGLAAALVVNGQVVPGAHGAAGEIGYLLSTPGEPAFAEGHAPLEEVVSGHALALRGSALLGRTVSAAALFDADGDPSVRALVDGAVESLAMAVANVCVVLDPERVVIGGGLMGASRHILPRLAEEVRRAVPFPPEITSARFVDDAPLYGALALTLTARA